MTCTIALAAAFSSRRVLPVLLLAHARGQEKKNRRYKYSGGGLHCARQIVKVMDVSGLASVRVCYDHNKALRIETIMIKRFCWGSVRVKGNVTELNLLTLCSLIPTQLRKMGPEHPSLSTVHANTTLYLRALAINWSGGLLY
jgi:hypothetical protein